MVKNNRTRDYRCDVCKNWPKVTVTDGINHTKDCKEKADMEKKEKREAEQKRVAMEEVEREVAPREARKVARKERKKKGKGRKHPTN